MPLSYRSYGSSPDHILFLCHGFLGQGRNWHSIAKRLVEALPKLGVVTPDLRKHGKSQDLPPPHTLQTCGEDLVTLAASFSEPVVALAGHSFGGKVVLEASQSLPRLEQVWVLDSTPAPINQGTGAEAVLSHLGALAMPMVSRKAVVEALVGRGLDGMTAQWVSTNLNRVEAGVEWGLELDTLAALLADFYEADYWPVVESPPPGVDVHILKAKDSDVLKMAHLQRIQSIEGTFFHEIAGGHWVNMANPDALVALLVQYLSDL